MIASVHMRILLLYNHLIAAMAAHATHVAHAARAANAVLAVASVTLKIILHCKDVDVRYSYV